jgi:hypothetical protein
VRVCVCVCVCARARARVCVSVRARLVCVCVSARARARVCVCPPFQPPNLALKDFHQTKFSAETPQPTSALCNTVSMSATNWVNQTVRPFLLAT